MDFWGTPFFALVSVGSSSLTYFATLPPRPRFANKNLWLFESSALAKSNYISSEALRYETIRCSLMLLVIKQILVARVLMC